MHLDADSPTPAHIAVRYDASTLAAYARYRWRERGEEKPPVGWIDDGGRWWPLTIIESRACCQRVRRPSRAWSYALLRHCSTAEHCGALEGTDPRRLRSLIQAIARDRMPARTALADLCLTCGASWACEHQPWRTAALDDPHLRPVPDEYADMSLHLGA